MNNRVLRWLSLVLIVCMTLGSMTYADTSLFEDETITMDDLKDAPLEEDTSGLVTDQGISTFKDAMHAEEDFKVSYDESGQAATFLTGFKSTENIHEATQAESFVETYRQVMGYDFGSFDVLSTVRDGMNKTHYKMAYKVSGIPVYGSEVILHTNSNNEVYAMNSSEQVAVENIDYSSLYVLSSHDAIKKAEASLDFELATDTYTQIPQVDQFIYAYGGSFYPVYLVTLEFLSPYPAYMKIFVNAEDGSIVDAYNGLADADGPTVGSGLGTDGNEKTINTYLYEGQYYLYDDTKAMTGQIATYDINHGGEASLPGNYAVDADNNFNSESQKAAVDAHFFAGVTYDYFLSRHNRDSFDNKGTSIKSTVHFGNNYNNAFWSGSQMVYGDGDGQQFSPLSGALDVVAHELAHAVTQHSANLEYRNQSGALNESYSDVFGSAAEYMHTGQEDWWVLAEAVWTPHTVGDSMRNMKTPELGNQPSHMDQYNPTTQDNGGVHINSGIPNKAYYLAAMEMGVEKAEKIYYRALTTYLTRTSNFAANRNALLQSAKDLYGNNSSEYIAIANAQAAVGIGQPIGGAQLKAASLSVDDASNAGTYTLTMTVPSRNKATSLHLYENETTEVYTRTLSADQGEAGVYKKSFTNKPAGTYTYRVDVKDGQATLSSSLLTVTVATVSGEKKWFTDAVSYDTPHDYANNYTKTLEYKKTGASKVAIHFSRVNLENNYDYVYIIDENDVTVHTLTGSITDAWYEVEGQSLKIKMVTDAYVTDWGFRIDGGKYYATGLLD